MNAQEYNTCREYLNYLDDILRPAAKRSPDPKHIEMYEEGWEMMHFAIEQFAPDDDGED